MDQGGDPADHIIMSLLILKIFITKIAITKITIHVMLHHVILGSGSSSLYTYPIIYYKVGPMAPLVLGLPYPSPALSYS